MNFEKPKALVQSEALPRFREIPLKLHHPKPLHDSYGIEFGFETTPEGEWLIDDVIKPDLSEEYVQAARKVLQRPEWKGLGAFYQSGSGQKGGYKFFEFLGDTMMRPLDTANDYDGVVKLFSKLCAEIHAEARIISESSE
jgi:hypothetical protein